MRAVSILPEDYKEIYSIDLQKNKKMALIVNLIAIFISILLAVPMHFIIPFSTLFDMAGGSGSFPTKLLVLFLLLIAYIPLHELVHGIAMKLCGTQKIKYGFTGMYAFAGSDDYYGKRAYIFIALAPIILWGIVLAIINLLVPVEWFWVIYFIQIMNISGAAGDLFVTVRFSRLPKNILVRDYGVSMTVYSNR